MGHPPRRPRHPFPRPGGVRNPRWPDRLCGSGTGRRPGHRTARRRHDRTHAAPISARRSSPSTGPITGSTVPPRSPGSPMRPGRPRPTARAGADRRRRRTRPSAGRRTGPPDRRAGCGEPRMEAGPGDQGDFAGKPARHLPRRAPPGRRPRAAQHDGRQSRFAARTTAQRPCARRWPSSSAWTSRARRFAAMMSGLDIHYDLGEGHPLLGRRMPDLDLVTANGPLRVFTLLHDARPVLLNLGEPGGFDITPWADRVKLIDAKYDGAWELPALGAVTAPDRRVDPARRICRLGGRPPCPGPSRRANHLVRTACCRVALRLVRRPAIGAEDVSQISGEVERDPDTEPAARARTG